MCGKDPHLRGQLWRGDLLCAPAQKALGDGFGKGQEAVAEAVELQHTCCWGPFCDEELPDVVHLYARAAGLHATGRPSSANCISSPATTSINQACILQPEAEGGDAQEAWAELTAARPRDYSLQTKAPAAASRATEGLEAARSPADEAHPN